MPKLTNYVDVCVVCGHPACHRMRLTIDATPMRVWWLCETHAEVVARRDYAIQLDPNWGGKWLYGRDSNGKESSGIG